MTTIAETCRQEGRVNGMAKLVSGQLQQRFGALPEARQRQLESASEPELERWSRRLLEVADLDSVFG